MLTYARGNILESDCEVLVNPVNCRGVMGAGLALAFARRYPAMVLEYKVKCSAGELKIGTIHAWRPKTLPPSGPWKTVVNLPTMDRPGEQARLDVVILGLNLLGEYLEFTDARSVAVPALGCGIGRLPFRTFKVAVEAFADKLPAVYVEVYEPRSF